MNDFTATILILAYAFLSIFFMIRKEMKWNEIQM